MDLQIAYTHTYDGKLYMDSIRDVYGISPRTTLSSLQGFDAREMPSKDCRFHLTTDYKSSTWTNDVVVSTYPVHTYAQALLELYRTEPVGPQAADSNSGSSVRQKYGPDETKIP